MYSYDCECKKTNNALQSLPVSNQPWPKGGRGSERPPGSRSVAPVNLKLVRLLPSSAMLLSTTNAPSGGNVITFCSVLPATSTTLK